MTAKDMTSIRHHIFEKLKRFFADNLKEKQMDMRKIMQMNDAAERRRFESLSHAKHGGKFEQYLYSSNLRLDKQSMTASQ